MASTRVRAAAPSDAAAVTAVHLASRAAAMPWLPRLHTDEETAARVRDVLLPGSRVWVADEAVGEPVSPEPVAAEVGGAPRVVGCAALDGDVLDQLCLLPGERGRGVGTLVLEAVRAASPGGLVLRVFARDAAARAFYERRGFEPVGADGGSGTEEGLPDVTCRWSPAP